MFTIVVIIASIFLAFRLWSLMDAGDDKNRGLSNGSQSGLYNLWNLIIDDYGVPLGHICISFLYSVYMRCTIFNLSIFVLKYVPTGVYMYKFVKDIYATSRERIKQKQTEFEDIQLQIRIMNTKICVREAECTERAEQLRRDAEHLRRLRTHVRNTIVVDEAFRHTMDGSAVHDEDPDININNPQKQDRNFIVEVLKGLKNQNKATSEYNGKLECGGCKQNEKVPEENSEYSSLSDIDMKPDCQVKIVKVTNVYKVAYLKHFIKHKRLRRVHKHSLLKKRMESIKKLLEDWQKALSMVLNNKLTILNMESQIDVASQEAMGDFSKPNQDFSDSDSDLINSSIDMSKNEYSLSWAQNPYKTYCCNYEDFQETAMSQFCEPQDFEVKYPVNKQCDFPEPQPMILSVLPEETTSQIAIEELKYDAAQEYIVT